MEMFLKVVSVVLLLLACVYYRASVDTSQSVLVLTYSTGIIDAPDGSAIIVLVPSYCVDATLHVVPSCYLSMKPAPESWVD